MKVRITKATSNLYWYANMIGKVFDVSDSDSSLFPGDYMVISRDECYLAAGDCEIVEHSPSSYQRAAARTLIPYQDFTLTDEQFCLLRYAVGLSDEAGKVLEEVKKAVFHHHGIDKEKLKKELGDNLWYNAAMCTILGLDMGEVMQENISKLLARYPDGFDPQRSMERKDEQNNHRS